VIRRVAAKGWSSNYSGTTAAIGATVLHAKNLSASTAHGRMAACHSRYRLVQDMVLNVGGRTLWTPWDAVVGMGTTWWAARSSRLLARHCVMVPRDQQKKGGENSHEDRFRGWERGC
jgi:hypothetical protein